MPVNKTFREGHTQHKIRVVKAFEKSLAQMVRKLVWLYTVSREGPKGLLSTDDFSIEVVTARFI